MLAAVGMPAVADIREAVAQLEAPGKPVEAEVAAGEGSERSGSLSRSLRRNGRFPRYHVRRRCKIAGPYLTSLLVFGWLIMAHSRGVFNRFL
jgi:hypothetical protein